MEYAAHIYGRLAKLGHEQQSKFKTYEEIGVPCILEAPSSRSTVKPT